MTIVLWGLFCVLISIGVVLVDVSVNLNEIGKQLHRIAFWTEDYYEDKREGRA